mmetsp:Transcript_15456/g.39120  ORF Transcript_15456/g.39120 Transcript_15456/m.39120 type:complete len:115 (+) Transcript_15456:252-596(+)
MFARAQRCLVSCPLSSQWEASSFLKRSLGVNVLKCFGCCCVALRASEALYTDALFPFHHFYFFFFSLFFWFLIVFVFQNAQDVCFSVSPEVTLRWPSQRSLLVNFAHSYHKAHL